MSDFISKQFSKDSHAKTYLVETDSNEDLHLIHYKDKLKDGRSFIEVWQSFNGDTKCPYTNCRGVVYDNNGNMVCRSFPYTNTAVCSSDEFVDAIKNKSNDAKFYTHIEGTILRVFTYKDTLYVSSHRKLQCDNSTWYSNTTFRQMFDEALSNANKTLEDLKHPTRCYVFIVIHPDNQIINSNPVTPKIVHLQTWERKGKVMYFLDDVDLGIEKQVPVNKQEAITLFKQGEIILSDGLFSKTKYVPQHIQRLYDIRGNNKSLEKLYHVIRSTPDREAFISTLPHAFKDIPIKYEAGIDASIDYAKQLIYGLHLQKDAYIKNPILYNIYKECHLLDDPELFKTKVDERFNNLDCEQQYSLYKFYRNKKD